MIRRVIIEFNDTITRDRAQELCCGEEAFGICLYLLPKTDHWHANADARHCMEEMLAESSIRIISDEEVA